MVLNGTVRAGFGGFITPFHCYICTGMYPYKCQKITSHQRSSKRVETSLSRTLFLSLASLSLLAFIFDFYIIIGA